jgi:outer membrane protein
VRPLPNAQAFGAANGALQIVVACGLSADESYTYNLLLSNLGIGLLAFGGDETPQKVVQEFADKLKLSFQGSPPDMLPATYIFAGKDPHDKPVRLILQTAKAGSTPFLLEGASKEPAAAGGSETLFDLYLLAKANDPDLGRSQSRYLGSQADTDVARAAFRPRLYADFGVSWLSQGTYNSGTGTVNSDVFGFNYDLVGSAPILHFSSFHDLASARAAERGEEADVAATRQNLLLKLAQAYFATLTAKGDEQISREETSRVKQTLEQAQAFLKAGTGDIIAVYEAKARLDSVLADQNRSESTLKLSDQRLSSIVGRVVPSIADLQPKRPKSPEPDDLEWWLTTMEKKDPQILQTREGLTSTAEQTESARAIHLPTIDATAGYDVNKGAAYAPTEETRQWHVGAMITVPIYSGGDTSARVRRAAANETERRYALDQVREQRRDNLKQSFFNLRYNVSLIKALEEKQGSALLQLDAIKKGRSIGTRTAIDLLNGEAAYAVAQRDLKNALYDNVVQVIELKAAAGILSEEDLAQD